MSQPLYLVLVDLLGEGGGVGQQLPLPEADLVPLAAAPEDELAERGEQGRPLRVVGLEARADLQRLAEQRRPPLARLGQLQLQARPLRRQLQRAEHLVRGVAQTREPLALAVDLLLQLLFSSTQLLLGFARIRAKLSCMSIRKMRQKFCY